MRQSLVAVLLAFVSLPALANLELTLRVDSSPYDGGKVTGYSAAPGYKAPAPKQSVVRLTLAPAWTRYEEDGDVTIHDFARRAVYVTHAGRTIVRSLFADVGARDAEMENRLYQNRLTEGHSIPLIVSEHDLSIASGATKDRVQRSEKDGVVYFRWGDVDFADFDLDMMEASAADRVAFARFVRHRFGAHPVVLHDLRSAKGIPRRLRVIQPVQSREYRVAVTAANVTPDAPYTTVVAHSTLESDPQLGPIVAQLRNITPGIAAADEQEILARAMGLTDAKKNVDAFLTWMEYMMVTGHDVPADVKTRATSVTDDPAVMKLMAAIHPESADEARESLVTLRQFHVAAPEKGYLIHIFEGDILSNLGDSTAAKKNFTEALKKRPRIAGVWKDLGEVFFSTSDAARAWDCWTIARRLAPRHSMLTDLTKYEERLQKDYPESF